LSKIRSRIFGVRRLQSGAQVRNLGSVRWRLNGRARPAHGVNREKINAILGPVGGNHANQVATVEAAPDRMGAELTVSTTFWRLLQIKGRYDPDFVFTPPRNQEIFP
jgi:hypothetical protein